MLKRWGHRVCDPAETVEIIRPHFDRMGITRLADVTGLDRAGVPVAQAVRPMGRSLSVSQGKGPSLDAAIASAMMEAAEGWHAENVDLPTRRTTAAQCLPSEVFGGFPCTGEFPGDKELTFVPAEDLMSGGASWLPIDLVHKDYTRAPEDDRIVRTTNGLASGNTRDEAIASALHEVIERDAVADFEALSPEKRGRRRISSARARELDPTVQRLIDQSRASGFRFLFYDMTNDIGVSAVRADIGDLNSESQKGGGPRHRLFTGFGCHLSPKTALIRALTEAAQSRLTQIAGSRDDLKSAHYLPPSIGLSAHILGQAADVLTHGFANFDYVDASRATAKDDVDTLLSKLREAGRHHVLGVDLSRTDIPMHVMRIVVPGLGYLESHLPVRGKRHD